MRSVSKSDIALAVFVVAITGMLLVPLPPPLLDVLLVINLSFAFLLLLTVLYIPNALALLAFPTLLLLTTLFRLSLNVASTRLILSRGEAGEVIRTFGTLLIGSEIVVGIIIFTIITVVNFIVIAKGSSRVSEVAARFALDALPGKQMAIDADLRAGSITNEQAHARREELRKESQLYGAMDGAMKFVQGDAIAGIIIIFANILGGLFVGTVNHGLSLSDAVQTFTILTVGDGLVHQIPALLISICAGIVVTRVSSGENTTLGSDVGAQLFTRPGTLMFSGSLLAVLGPLSGLPVVPFVVVGGSLFGGGVYLRRFMDKNPLLPIARGENAMGRTMLLPGTNSEEERGEENPLLVVLDSGVLHRLYKMNAARYTAWWEELREDFINETGLKLPLLQVEASEGLRASSFSIKVGGAVVEEGSIFLDSVLVEVSPDAAPAYGLDVVAEAVHPVDGSRVFWSNLSPSLRRISEAGGIRVYDFLEFIGLRVARFYRDHPEEILGVAEVHNLLKQVEKRHGGLIADAFGKGGLNVALLTELLQRLMKARVSLRDFRSILELIATYCSANRVSLDAQESLDFEDIISFIRAARKRHLTASLMSHRRTLKTIRVGGDVRRVLNEAEVSENNGELLIEPQVFAQLRAGLVTLLDPIRIKGIPPVVILCDRSLRSKVARLIRSWEGTTGVLTDDEVDETAVIEAIGDWGLGIGINRLNG